VPVKLLPRIGVVVQFSDFYISLAQIDSKVRKCSCARIL
jgi:hypothetical protein